MKQSTVSKVKIQQWKTGAIRDSKEGKGRFDLTSPLVDRLLAQHFQKGGARHGDRNWEKGIPFSSFYDSARRHLASEHEGMKDEDHLVSALWNIYCWIHTREMIKRGKLPKFLDDLPKYST